MLKRLSALALTFILGVGTFAIVGRVRTPPPPRALEETWREQWIEALRAAEDGTLVSLLDSYYERCKRDRMDLGAKYGLWITYDIYRQANSIVDGSGKRTAKFPRAQIMDDPTNFDYHQMRELYKYGRGTAPALVAYARYVSVFREPGMPESWNKTISHVPVTNGKGQKETAEFHTHTGPDIPKIKRVAALYAEAEKLAPNDPFVLLYKARRIDDAKKRFELLQKCYFAGGKELFRYDIRMDIEATAKLLEPETREFAEALKTRYSEPEHPFWAWLFSEQGTFDARTEDSYRSMYRQRALKELRASRSPKARG